MRAVLPVIAGLLLLASARSAADPVKMTGAEIQAALTGHSIEGVWGSTRYVSSFDAHGGTVYTAEGRAPSQGRWSVKGGRYCSVWEQSGESCYELERDGDTILWIDPETGARYPSTLRP